MKAVFFFTFFLILFHSVFFANAQNLEVEGKTKIAIMENTNSSDSVVVRLADGTLGLQAIPDLPFVSNQTPFGKYYFFDEDFDGFGTIKQPVWVPNNVAPPQMFVDTSGDCNDLDSTIYPGAIEICDSVDNDCNNVVDDSMSPEICGDEIDNNCDGQIDEICDVDEDGVLDYQDNCPDETNPDQADLDGDGLGDVCDEDVDGDGLTEQQGDCHDFNSNVNSGQMQYFSTPYALEPYSPGFSFDYNCDNQETKRWSTLAVLDAPNNFVPGWENSVPACGASNLYYIDWDVELWFETGIIEYLFTIRTQECK